VSGFSSWVVGARIRGASWQAGLGDALLAFSVHVPSRGEAYWKQVNKLLDEIGRMAGRREVIIGGDFNVTVSNWTGSERPVSEQELAIQMRLADEFGFHRRLSRDHSQAGALVVQAIYRRARTGWPAAVSAF
jgi:endonuclease/exonuclease/phosphatase family metal-dependent hydrolase